MNRLAGTEFAGEASRAMALLEQEAALEEIVRLVGKDTLSPQDRLTLEVARSIREDFLHQNAFHEVDTYASLAKQARMLSAILRFHDLARQALEHGADANELEQLPVRERLARMKYLAEHEAGDVIADIVRQLERELPGARTSSAATEAP
jgi:V/A-type H+-transporting ATPase subunit A